jgi:hypothetical protein
MVGPKTLPVILLSLLALTLPATAAVTVSVDRDPVGLEESFQITFEADSTLAEDPDFGPLEKDFDILSTGRASNIQIGGGHYSATTRWTVEAMARRPGTLTIPALRFGAQHSPTRTITVHKTKTPRQAGTGADILVEVDVSPRNPYVQQEVLYTVRLYRAVTTHNATLTDPAVTGAQAVIKRLGEDAHFETRRGGRHYRVVERRYAVFPQVSGALTIEPVVFEGRVGRGSRFMFDPFGGTRTLRRLSQAIALDVRPIPAAFHGKTWLPARQLELQETWSQTPPVFKVGEPLTRTVALIAGGLSSGQLPELDMPLPAGFKRYPDQPELRDNADPGGVVGIRQEKTALIPRHPGEVVLPAVELPWWNTQQDRQEIAGLPERRIQVLPGPPVPARPAAPVDPKGPPQTAPTLPAGVQAPAGTEPLWMAISLALGWLGTLLLWWRHARRPTPRRTGERGTDGLKAAVRSLERACRQGQALQAKEALLHWAEAAWPDSPPTSLEQLGARCGARMQTETAHLSRALYGRGTSGWDGGALAEAFRACQAQPRPAPDTEDVALEPLYRIQQP